MGTIAEQLAEAVKHLPEQDAAEVLDFVEFLAKRRRVALEESRDKEPVQPPQSAAPSFYDLTKEFCGCIEGGPSDVSTNPKYMEGFGE